MRHAWFGIDVIFPILTLLAAALVASDTGGTASYIGTLERRPESRIDNDPAAEQLLAKGKVDARQWLGRSNEKHLVWKWDRAAALDAVNDLHKSGAPNVWVTNVTKVGRGNSELSSTFVVGLPIDSAARKRVFAWIARWEQDAAIDLESRTVDLGQKYFVINTDQ